MGQYVQIGICQKINIFKCDMERHNVELEEIVKKLNEEVNLDLYNMNETDNGYTFLLKDDYLQPRELTGFLSEQYKLSVYGDECKAMCSEIISKLNELEKVEDIIELAKRKCYQYFQHSKINDGISCGVWRKYVPVQYDIVLFLLEGKIEMECYYTFLKYIEKLIRQHNKYKVSGAVKAFIE